MAKVIFTTDNMEAEVPDGTEMRDPCENNFNIPFGCKDGICGTCRIRVEKGTENLTPKNDKEEDLLPNKPDERLACQCQVKSGEVTINDGYD